MMLVHPLLSKPLEFKENAVNVLTVENRMAYREILRELISQHSGNKGTWVLSENFTPCEISQNVELITDVFNIDFSAKSLITKINKEAEKLSGEIEMTGELIRAINSFGTELVSAFDFNVSFNAVETPASVIKLLGLFVDTETSSFAENLLDYINLHIAFLKKRLFVVVNLKSVLSTEELKVFYKTVLLNKINILLIEPNQSNIISDYEVNTIIDDDLCEI